MSVLADLTKAVKDVLLINERQQAQTTKITELSRQNEELKGKVQELSDRLIRVEAFIEMSLHRSASRTATDVPSALPPPRAPNKR